jgi:ATP-dependent DNA helicase RecG
MDELLFRRLLSELRTHRTDHQTIEAKRAKNALPATSHETLSAFGNADGGFFLLGVDEGDGDFEVTGVADPAKLQQDFSSLCNLMEPPLRAVITLIEHEAKTVLAAEIAPVPRYLRPCHRRSDGPYQGSFVRVGDADQALSRDEVDEMLAERAGHGDLTARPSPRGAKLDPLAIAVFIDRLRELHAPDTDADVLQRQFGVIVDGEPSIAGVLSLGDGPQTFMGAARIAYRVLPTVAAPQGSRFSGEHAEGTIGELLDGAMRLFERDLRTFQVVGDDGHVRDELDVPREALREILSNALLHRSFTTRQETKSIAIEITEMAVVITSPGGLHVGADLARLGLDPVSGVRNLSLVRICQPLKTPAGARIIENQASGIANADQACHRAGAMPALFLDLPDMFQVVLLRGSLPTDRATEALELRNVSPVGDALRVASVAFALEESVEALPTVPLARLALDARLGARALAPSTAEDAASVLRRLEDARVLQRRASRHTPSWVVSDVVRAVPADAKSKQPHRSSKQSRVPELLIAIAESPASRLASSGIGAALGLKSPTSINRWIRHALGDELIEASSDNPTDPTKTYSLTPAGIGRVDAIKRRSGKADGSATRS